MTDKCFMVTGGAGFIGSAVIRHIINNTNYRIVNVDKLTYAGNLETLSDATNNPRYSFEKVDISDTKQISRILSEYRPDAVMHLAAESHVDRSIDRPFDFIQTNIVGTYTLLNEGYKYWCSLDTDKREKFRFLHISTDEVFGSLGDGGLFTEDSPYKPSSPYSASKASSDHLVRAWFTTYGFPALVTNCSNNYGPYQYTEKLIPLMILNALEGNSLPIYGNGKNVRDWLYVDDHARALVKVVEEGRIGETYNIGGDNEKTNLEVVQEICKTLDNMFPESPYRPFSNLINFVSDRPGHDQRYAIDASKIMLELNWRAEETFSSGIQKTIQWYIDNRDWCADVSEDIHRDRLGLSSGKETVSG